MTGEMSEDLYSYDDSPVFSSNSKSNVSNEHSAKKRLYKYAILLLLCFVQASKSYCNNLTIGLQHTIIQVMRIDNTRYGILYSAEMYPNIFMPLIGGIIVDRLFGAKQQPLLVLATVILLGQFVFTAGAFTDIFWVMVFGRVIIGFGDAIQSLVYSCFTLWFMDDLTFTLSIAITCARLGAALAISFSQQLYNSLELFSIYNQNVRLGMVLLVGCISAFIALLCIIAVVWLDERGERAGLVIKPSKAEAKINIHDLKDFSLTFWLVFLALSLFYSTIFSFVANGQLLFVSKFSLSVTEASIANSIIYIGVIFFNTFVGKLINICGYHILWCVAGIILTITSILLMLFANMMKSIPFIAGCTNALSYSMFATAIWPIVPQIVQSNQLNTAYGILNCSWIGPIVAVLAGTIIDNIGYSFQMMFYLTLYSVAILSLLMLLIVMKNVR